MAEEKMDQKLEEQTAESENLPTETEPSENVESQAFSAKEKKAHDEIVEIVDASRILVENVEKEIKEAMDQLNEDIRKLEEVEEEVLSTTLKEAEELFKEVGYEEDLANVEIPHPSFEYDKKDALPPIKRPSSGKFSAFILGLLGGVATAAGIGYFAMENLKIPTNAIPNKDQITEILKWVGEQIGAGANETIGAAVVGIAAFIVFLIIYKIKVSLTASKNVKLAETIKNEAYKHKSKREERKEEIIATDEHVNKARELLENLNVLLQEYNAKLKRILHFEGKKDYNELHEKSKNDIEDAFNIAKEIKLIIVTPESQNGEINPESLEVVQNAQTILNRMIQKLY